MEQQTMSESSAIGAPYSATSPDAQVEQLENYLESLNKKERKAYEIAKSHLGMSFQLEKSVGYLKWKN